jgi:hypothetical protein
MTTATCRSNPSDTFAHYLKGQGRNQAEDLDNDYRGALAGAMELSFVFNAFTLGEDAVKRMGLEGKEDMLKRAWPEQGADRRRSTT